jgi:5-methylcytosine-specific restriction endonuclease McrA
LFAPTAYACIPLNPADGPQASESRTITMPKGNKSTYRRVALMVKCPKCHAPPGAPCTSSGEPRRAIHRARHTAFVDTTDLFPRIVQAKPAGFYQSDEWRDVRYRALVKHGGACQCCGARPTRGHPLHVDHIKPRSKFPHLALDVENLQVLCEDCNLGKRAWDQTDWRQRS